MVCSVLNSGFVGVFCYGVFGCMVGCVVVSWLFVVGLDVVWLRIGWY